VKDLIKFSGFTRREYLWWRSWERKEKENENVFFKEWFW